MSMNKLKDRYDGICPVCGTEIPNDVREGDECTECGQLFEMYHEPEPTLDDWEKELSK